LDQASHNLDVVPSLFDPEGAKQAARQKRERKALGDWLSTLHWQFYATVTFSVPVSFALAESAAASWIRRLGARVYAWVAFERGQAGDLTHFHALIGGLPASRRGGLHEGDHPNLVHTPLRALWGRGQIKVERFNPAGGAPWYCAKYPETGAPLGAALKRHRSRGKRGGRGRGVGRTDHPQDGEW
jgi:hypothetical protein